MVFSFTEFFLVFPFLFCLIIVIWFLVDDAHIVHFLCTSAVYFLNESFMILIQKEKKKKKKKRDLKKKSSLQSNVGKQLNMKGIFFNFKEPSIMVKSQNTNSLSIEDTKCLSIDSFWSIEVMFIKIGHFSNSNTILATIICSKKF